MITVTGLPSLHAKLARLATGMAAAAPVAAEAGAQVLEEGAKELVPVDKGDLKESLHVEAGAASPVSGSAEVVTDNDHAGYQEFGTSVMEAQPFLRPTADEKGAEVQAAQAAVFKGAIAAAT